MFGALNVESTMRKGRGRVVPASNAYTLPTQGSSPRGNLVSSSQPIAPKIGAVSRGNLDRTPEMKPVNPSQDAIGLNDDGSFTRGGSHNRRHFVGEPDKQAEEFRKSKELAESLKQQIVEKQHVHRLYNQQEQRAGGRHGGEYEGREVSRYRNNEPQPVTQVNRSPHPQQHHHQNAPAAGAKAEPRVIDETRFISPSRRAPVPGQSSFNSSAQLGMYSGKPRSNQNQNAEYEDHNQHQEQQQQRGRQMSEEYGGGGGGHLSQQQLVQRGSTWTMGGQHGLSDDSVVYAAGAKAAPGWLLEDPEQAGSGDNFGPRYDTEIIEDQPTHSLQSPPVGGRPPHHVSPMSQSQSYSGRSPKRLFDHEKRQAEEIIRKKQALSKVEQLKLDLEEQILENKRRREKEKEKELELEREMEARRMAEAEAVAARERADVERERSNLDAVPSAIAGSGGHKTGESVADKRRRLREDQIRAQQEGQAGSSNNNPNATPQRQHTRAVSVSLSPSPSLGASKHASLNEDRHSQSWNPQQQSMMSSQDQQLQQQEILNSLETIKTELMEQRKKLNPLIPLSHNSVGPASTADDGSLVSHTHQVSVKQSSMTPPPGGSGHWNHGPTPYGNSKALIPIAMADHNPAKEILNRNKYRLSALGNGRKSNNDVLRSFLMDDRSSAIRGLDRMKEY